MLKSIELSNFKKHESLSIIFDAGLNVMRAANEEGKSTIYHAIAYALWGSRALPMSLEETVTWGKPVSSLKVKFVFAVAGVDYVITRSKNSAELSGGGFIASGQNEVTAAVERLTGASMHVGYATLMAKQGSLSKLLEGEAVPLIEKLSQLNLIDTFISLIQDQCLCGNTKTLDLNIAQYASKVKPEADFSELVAEKQRASISSEAALVTRDAARLELEQAEVAAKAAEIRIKEQALLDQKRKGLMSQKAQLEETLTVVPVAPTGYTVAALEAMIAEEQVGVLRRNAYKRFLTLRPLEYSPQIAKDFGIAAKSKLLVDLGKQLTTALREVGDIKAAGIYQDSCALCGKLLTDVPEVVAINAKVAVQVHVKEQEIAALQVSIAEEQTALDNLRDLQGRHATNENIIHTLSGYVTAVPDSVPLQATWVGDVPDTGSYASPDYKAMLAVRRKQDQDYDTKLALLESARKSLSAVDKSLANLPADTQLPDDEVIVSGVETCRRKAYASDEKLNTENLRYRGLESQLTMQEQMHYLAVKRFDEEMAQLATWRQQLAEMVFNNQLVKKLREARPVVARELWSHVLHSVSHVFSQIRGTPSVVTYEDNTFKIDGKPAEAYSGSTKDSLGLAIRMCLQKTFLSNLPVMLLDEPASGCDSVRESDMLASVVSSDFAQVLLVTHSELADTFANRLIEL